ncbi:MAG: hypothetical protein ABJB03_03380 [Rhodoglobus sp.]
MTTSPEQVYPASTPAPLPEARYRNLAAAVTVFLGGYLVLSAISGVLVNQLAGVGPQPELLALLLLQLVFAVLVVVVGFFLSNAPVPRKLIGSAIVVVAVPLYLVLQAGRLTGSINGGIPLSMTFANPYFMTVLAVGAGWLVVRGARLGWLALLVAAVLIPLPFGFAMANISYGISQIVLLFVCAVFGIVIIAAGRPLRG